jgi:hypothetical protein
MTQVFVYGFFFLLGFVFCLFLMGLAASKGD